MKKRIKTFFSLVFLTLECALAIVLVSGLAIFWKFSNQMGSVDFADGEIHTPVPTTILSSDGVVLAKLEVENRQPISLDEMPENIKKATVAIEDHRFYEHPGVDVVGIGRAMVANLRGSSMRQGASTLTQQLVRQPGLASQFGLSTEKRFSRKIREAFIALRMEQLYSKQQILQYYLNTVYYGAGAYGIQAASLTYFGKSASKLTLPEAAMLAGLPQSPSEMTPFLRPKAALKRRDEVLSRMLEYGNITQQEYDKALQDRPKLSPPPKIRGYNFKAPYFVTSVLRDLTSRFGTELVRSGIRVETTLNWKMQLAAEEALEQGLQNAGGRRANQGAIISIDPTTGYIRAMVGGRNFKEEQFNAVTQGRRQPGSTFKLFDYAAAFDSGVCNLNSVFRDSNFAYAGDPYHRVVSGSGRSMTVKSAIAFSKNAVAIRVADKTGIRTIIDYAHKMGITTKLDPVLPTALGASSVRPIDLCSAYSLVALKGSRCLPMAIISVTDADGTILKTFQPQMQSGILKKETIDMLDTAFEAVVHEGSGTAARGNESTGIVENAHGKTGTTNDNRDVWFAGYTPELATVVWVANVRRHGHKRYYEEMPGAFGGTVCAPIWHNYMLKAVPEQRKFMQANQVAPATIMNPAQTAAAQEKKPANQDSPSRPSHQDENIQEPTSPDTTPLDGDTGTEGPGSTGDQGTGPADYPANPQGETDPSTRTGVETGRRNVPSGRIVAPPTRTAAVQERVTVTICAETNRRANRWCPVQNTVTMTAAEARRLRTCRVHKDPEAIN